MTNVDFSPLFRSIIGFDRLASALESAARSEAGGYPPLNLEAVDESRYRLTMVSTSPSVTGSVSTACSGKRSASSGTY